MNLGFLLCFLRLFVFMGMGVGGVPAGLGLLVWMGFELVE